MQARRFLLVFLILSVVAVFSMTLSVSAQATDGPTLVAQALRDAGTNCANLAINTTCLAHATVQRTTSSGVVSTTYTQPGDRASINTTHRIQTGALNPTTGDFGVNVMKAQVGLAASTGGVVYVALGGTTVTNVGGVGQAVWQNIAVTMAPGTAAGATNLFLAQGPKNAVARITINNVPVEIHSTVAAQVNADGSVCIFVLSGSAILFPGTTQQLVVNAGYKSCGTVAGGSAPALFTADEIATLQVLSLIPGNVLNYVFTLPVVVCPSGVGQANCTVTSG